MIKFTWFPWAEGQGPDDIDDGDPIVEDSTQRKKRYLEMIRSAQLRTSLSNPLLSILLLQDTVHVKPDIFIFMFILSYKIF